MNNFVNNSLNNHNTPPSLPLVQHAITRAFKIMWRKKLMILKLFSIPAIFWILIDSYNIFISKQPYNISFIQKLLSKTPTLTSNNPVAQHAVNISIIPDSLFTTLITVLVGIFSFIIIFYVRSATNITIIRNDLLTDTTDHSVHLSKVYKPKKRLWRYIGIKLLFIIIAFAFIVLAFLLSVNKISIQWISILDQILSFLIIFALLYFYIKLSFVWIGVALEHKKPLISSLKTIKGPLFFKLFFGLIILIILDVLIFFIQQVIFYFIQYTDTHIWGLLLELVLLLIFRLINFYLIATKLYFVLVYYKESLKKSLSISQPHI